MEMFTVDTTAQLLGRSTKTVRRLVQKGKLDTVLFRAGSAGRPPMMITADSVVALLNSRKDGKNYENTGRD